MNRDIMVSLRQKFEGNSEKFEVKAPSCRIEVHNGIFTVQDALEGGCFNR